MNAISAFSGIGLLDFGLSLAGIDHLWLCEKDEWRRGILAQRFPGVPIFDDIRAVDGAAPCGDLFVGGFPCRGASSAGDKAGMGNPETALWRQMARCIGDLRPRLVLIENVANLLAVGGRSDRCICGWPHRWGGLHRPSGKAAASLHGRTPGGDGRKGSSAV